MRFLGNNLIANILGSTLNDEVTGGLLKLFVDGTNIVPNMTLADLAAIEATFTGYTPFDLSTAVITGPYPTGVGGYGYTIQGLTFTAGAGPTITPNTIAGWFIDDNTGTPHHVVMYGTFDITYVINQPNQELIPIITIQIFPTLN